MSDRFDDVMLDIETMSLHPSNALILSIGLTHFDPTPGDGPVIGETWLIRPRLEDQLLLGRHVDPKTQAFWAAQPESAQKDWASSAPRMSMLETYDSIAEATENAKRLWANGIVFDIGNVASLIRQTGREEPWHYRAPRDMRTLCEHTEPRRMPSLKAFDEQGTPHTALYDNLVQIYRVWQHWPTAAELEHHSV